MFSATAAFAKIQNVPLYEAQRPSAEGLAAWEFAGQYPLRELDAAEPLFGVTTPSSAAFPTLGDPCAAGAWPNLLTDRFTVFALAPRDAAGVVVELAIGRGFGCASAPLLVVQFTIGADPLEVIDVCQVAGLLTQSWTVSGRAVGAAPAGLVLPLRVLLDRSGGGAPALYVGDNVTRVSPATIDVLT